MASGGNPNQPAGFDVNSLFRPSLAANPNPNPTPTPSAPFLPPFSYAPPTAPAFHHHHHIPYLPYPPAPTAAGPGPIVSPSGVTSGARLMALLGTSSGNFDPVVSSPAAEAAEYSAPLLADAAGPSAPPARVPSGKLPNGRHLHGERVVYDIDGRQHGEDHPQLEVTPITRYLSDPQLVLGRQIAVNKAYICYGLKQGAVRVLNIHTALRALLREHTQRVSDMAFFAEDVNLLASSSIEGRISVLKIIEEPDEDEKPQISGRTIVSIQVAGFGETLHPRVCWHTHKQEMLFVGIQNCVLRVDTTKAGLGEVSSEEPLVCHYEKLVDGVQLIGKHEGEVTDLSICQWMTSRLASASADGTVIIWDERKSTPLVILKPHDGQPVNSAIFCTSPHRPDHVVLITAGYLNREVKLWSSSSDEGWLLPSDAESWKCIQTLELKSSAEARLEDAFFIQVVAVPRAPLILLANAKKNAIYAVHIEYGSSPIATRMDYLAEFSVTMPILSLTGTSDIISETLHIVQVYCVQTQAIQQYALHLSQCLPPPLDKCLDYNHFVNGSDENFVPLDVHEKFKQVPEIIPASKVISVPIVSDGIVHSMGEVSEASFETKQTSSIIDIDHAHVPPHPLSPALSGRFSGTRTSSNDLEQRSDASVVERRVETVQPNVTDVKQIDDDARRADKIVGPNDVSSVSSSTIMFRRPTHLVTPAEILSASASSSDRTDLQEKVMNKDADNVEVEVKVVGETGTGQPEKIDTSFEEKEKPIYTQASSSDTARTGECVLPSETASLESFYRPEDSGVVIESRESPSVAPLEDSGKEVEGKIPETVSQGEIAQSALVAKGKKYKVKTSFPPSPPPSDLASHSAAVSSSYILDTAPSQLLALQESLNQVVASQKELQKQIGLLVTVPVNKEGKRLETSLGRSMEKIVKANSDAMLARLQEENARHEKLERERVQQITVPITNSLSKDLPTLMEKILKKELSSVVSNITRSVTSVLEKSISSSIAESFQRGVGDKSVNQLEKSVSSKLEGTVARQLQTQFQTSGKQALQESLRLSLESSIIPAFELSCKAMFEQVDAAFRKGMSEHITASQQHLESSHSSLASKLKDTLSSATSMTQTLSGELADGQRKLIALIAAGANQKTCSPLATLPSNGSLGGLHDPAIYPQVEAPIDPRTELHRLVSEHKFEEAFTMALQKSDVSIVSWLCSQVDLEGIVNSVPPQLSQGVLLSLLQQVACDLGSDTARKLAWMRDVAVVIVPVDPTIAVHVRPIFDQVYQILINHQRLHPTTAPAEGHSLRILLHVINSVLMGCK